MFYNLTGYIYNFTNKSYKESNIRGDHVFDNDETSDVIVGIFFYFLSEVICKLVNLTYEEDILNIIKDKIIPLRKKVVLEMKSL